MPDTDAYTATQVRLHWIIAILLAGQYLLNEGIEAAWEGRLDGSIPNEPFPNPHAIVGILILLLTLWRIGLRLRHGAPALPGEEPQGLKIVARATHFAFYALLIAMPTSGALAWVAGLDLPAEAHEVAAKVMMALIVLHVAGALVQQFVQRTDVVLRMSPSRMFRRGPAKDAVR